MGKPVTKTLGFLLIAIAVAVGTLYHYRYELRGMKRPAGWDRVHNNCGDLKQIGLALTMYCADNGGAFPHDLACLWEGEYLTSPRLYVSPHSTTRYPKEPNEIRQGFCDYLYFGAGKTNRELGMDEPIAVPMARGRLLDDLLYVLFGDGHVKGYTNPPESVETAVRRSQVTVDQNDRGS